MVKLQVFMSNLIDPKLSLFLKNNQHFLLKTTNSSRKHGFLMNFWTGLQFKFSFLEKLNFIEEHQKPDGKHGFSAEITVFSVRIN